MSFIKVETVGILDITLMSTQHQTFGTLLYVHLLVLTQSHFEILVILN